MAGVAATYWAARRLWGIREGLVAAAVLAFAFLPVAYSRVAVTDVGALIGVALVARLRRCCAYERGTLRWFALAGAAAGLAVSFKYTAGLALLPLAIAALARLRVGRPARALGGLALGGGARRGVVFVVLNPYLFGSFDAWWSDLRDQAEVARDQPKPGQESGGVSYYLDSLTWGLGWAAAFAALAGAALELRRDLVRGLMLVAVPLALFVYLSAPVPLLRPLAAARLPGAGDAGRRGDRPGGGRCSRDELAHERPAGRALAAAGGLTVLVLAQPLAADVRSARRCSAATTRASRRATGSRRTTRRSCAAVDRAGRARALVPLEPRGHAPALAHPLRAPAGLDRAGLVVHGRRRRSASAPSTSPGLVARPDGGVRASAYHEVLDPGVIDDYRLYGYCLVVTVDTVRDRALQTGDRDARAYYDRLERESKVVSRPSARTTRAPTRSRSTSTSPSTTTRPSTTGPGRRSRSAGSTTAGRPSGPPIIRIPRAREPAPFGT